MAAITKKLYYLIFGGGLDYFDDDFSIHFTAKDLSENITQNFCNGSHLYYLQRANLKPYPKSTSIHLHSFLIPYIKFVVVVEGA